LTGLLFFCGSSVGSGNVVTLGTTRGSVNEECSSIRYSIPSRAASANDATDDFQIPTGRVVEVGTQVTIQGREPHKVPPKLSQDGNSFIVSCA
jgi:hypothetical protein